MSKRYCNVWAKAKGHKLNEASKEQILAIIQLFRDDKLQDTPSLFWKRAKDAVRVRQLWYKCKSDPAAPTDEETIYSTYFKEFGAAGGMTWSKFEKENPDYDPCTFPLSLPETLKELQSSIDPNEVDVEDLFQDDDTATDVQPADEDLATGSQGSLFTQSDSNHNNRNLQMRQPPSTTSPNLPTVSNQEDEQEDDDLSFRKTMDLSNWYMMANTFVTKFEEFKKNKGAQEAASILQNLGSELARLLIMKDIEVNEQVLGMFARIYDGAPPGLLETSINLLIQNSTNYLIKKGFINSSKKVLKPYVAKINNLFGINLQQHQQPLAKSPPRKRRKLNNNITGLQGNRPLTRSPNTVPSQQAIPLLQSLQSALGSNINAEGVEILQNILQNPTATINQSQPRDIPTIDLTTNSLPPSQPQSSPNSTQASDKQFAELNQKLQTLQNLVQNRMPNPVLSTNPNHAALVCSFKNPSRGFDANVVDFEKRMAMVRRSKEIINGAPIDENMRDLIKAMNISSNKDLSKYLQGTYSINCLLVDHELPLMTFQSDLFLLCMSVYTTQEWTK